MNKTWLLLVFVVSALIGVFVHMQSRVVVQLGDTSSLRVWVYLCGLTTEFNRSPELEWIDTLGHQAGIKFLALRPPAQCVQLNNRWCWPHDNESELMQTFHYIQSNTQNYDISGYLGFSNGGFFLLKLAQYVKVPVPLVAVGATSYLEKSDVIPCNNVTLVIGKQDEYHYSYAQEFFQQIQKKSISMRFIKYDGGHSIPINILTSLLVQL